MNADTPQVYFMPSGFIWDWSNNEILEVKRKLQAGITVISPGFPEVDQTWLLAKVTEEIEYRKSEYYYDE